MGLIGQRPNITVPETNMIESYFSFGKFRTDLVALLSTKFLEFQAPSRLLLCHLSGVTLICKVQDALPLCLHSSPQEGKKLGTRKGSPHPFKSETTSCRRHFCSHLDGSKHAPHLLVLKFEIIHLFVLSIPLSSLSVPWDGFLPLCMAHVGAQ